MVHPRNGEEVTVLKRHGPDALWVETSEGILTIIPVAWTDWRPRPAALELDGKPVRLAPEAMKLLSAWVAGRSRGSKCKKVGSSSRSVPGVHPDAAANESEGHGKASRVPARVRVQQSSHRSAAAVVEQAGTPDADRGSDSQTTKRGGR